MSEECDRRTFLTSSLAASTGLGTTASGGIFAKTVASTTEPPTKPIPKRPLGKTGYQVTIYGLGGLFTLARHDRHDEAVESSTGRSIWASTTLTPLPCMATVPVN